MADETKVPDLTLNPEEKEIRFDFAEPTLAGSGLSTVGETGVTAGAVDESELSEEERKKVEDFYKKIDITDIKVVNAYGATASKGISTLSSSVTSKIRNKDAGDIGQMFRDLEAAISSTTEPPKKGLLGIFQKGKGKIKYFISNFETAETSIKKIEKDLQKHQQILTKDVFLYDQMYDANIQYYKELTMYIIAGKKALADARSTRLVELGQKAEQTGDQLDVQMFRDYKDMCDRFERRIHDLEISRVISIQNAPQLRILQNAEQELVDKIRSDVLNTIPIWRNSMVLALGIDNSKRALDAHKHLTEMTNQMLQQNSERLKQGAIDIAIASEEDTIEIATLEKINSDIITSINEVIKIHEEGSKRRSEAETELVRIEEELKNALIDSGNN